MFLQQEPSGSESLKSQVPGGWENSLVIEENEGEAIKWEREHFNNRKAEMFRYKLHSTTYI